MVQRRRPDREQPRHERQTGTQRSADSDAERQGDRANKTGRASSAFLCVSVCVCAAASAVAALRLLAVSSGGAVEPVECGPAGLEHLRSLALSIYLALRVCVCAWMCVLISIVMGAPSLISRHTDLRPPLFACVCVRVCVCVCVLAGSDLPAQGLHVLTLLSAQHCVGAVPFPFSRTHSLIQH